MICFSSGSVFLIKEVFFLAICLGDMYVTCIYVERTDWLESFSALTSWVGRNLQEPYSRVGHKLSRINGFVEVKACVFFSFGVLLWYVHHFGSFIASVMLLATTFPKHLCCIAHKTKKKKKNLILWKPGFGENHPHT